MKDLFKILSTPWRKPTILEMAEQELKDAQRELFKSETLLVYHQSQITMNRSLIPVLERKIKEVRGA